MDLQMPLNLVTTDQGIWAGYEKLFDPTGRASAAGTNKENHGKFYFTQQPAVFSRLFNIFNISFLLWNLLSAPVQNSLCTRFSGCVSEGSGCRNGKVYGWFDCARTVYSYGDIISITDSFQRWGARSP